MNSLQKEYKIPFFGIIRIMKSKWYEKFLNGNYYAEIDKESKFLTHCKSVKDAREKLENFIYNELDQEKVKIQKRANELEEIATRVKESGLEKTSEYYKNSTPKKKEDKK